MAMETWCPRFFTSSWRNWKRTCASAVRSASRGPWPHGHGGPMGALWGPQRPQLELGPLKLKWVIFAGVESENPIVRNGWWDPKTFLRWLVYFMKNSHSKTDDSLGVGLWLRKPPSWLVRGIHVVSTTKFTIPKITINGWYKSSKTWDGLWLV